MEAIDDVTLERGVRRHDAPGREEPPRGLGAVQLLEVLARKPHELPAPAAASAGHERRRASGIADLDVERAPHLRLVRHDVDDEPVEEEPEIRDGRAKMGTNEAVGAVAADDVTRLDGKPTAIHRGDVQPHGPIGRIDADHLVSPVHLDGRQRTGARVEQSLELGLREHVRLRPARRARRLALEAEQRLARGVAPLVDVRRLGHPDEAVGDARGLQDASDLVVEVDSTG